jgi:hypothetical protein
MQLSARRRWLGVGVGVVVCGAVLVACDGGAAQSPAALADAALADAAFADAALADATLADAGISAFCAAETRDDDYAPGLHKVGAQGYTVVLLASVPAPPAKTNNTWTVRVLDPQGAPVDGLALDVYPFMPDHGHGTSAATIAPAGAVGEYTVAAINLYMSGLWTIRIALKDAGAQAEIDRVTFAFCVSR